MSYKTRIYKDSAYKRYEKASDMKEGDAAVLLPDNKIGKLEAAWLTKYFPFGEIVVKNNKKSADIQIYGTCKVKLKGFCK